MSYSHNKIPDAPMPLSMMPDVVTPTEDDLLYLVQPNNPPGSRSRRISLKKLRQSSLLYPEKVVVSSAPPDENVAWTVDLGVLKDTNRLVLVQNTSSPKTSCGITLSGNQTASEPLLDIVVVYGSWTGDLTLSGLAAGNYTLHSADGEWIRAIISHEGRIQQHSIVGGVFNKSSQGFSGQSGNDSFDIGPNGISLKSQNSHQNEREFSVDFDGENWNVDTSGSINCELLSAFIKPKVNDVLTGSGSTYSYKPEYDSAEEAAAVPANIIVNNRSSSVEVTFFGINPSSSAVTVKTVWLGVSESLMLIPIDTITGIVGITQDKYTPRFTYIGGHDTDPLS